MIPTLLALPLFVTTLVNDAPQTLPSFQPMTREDIRAARDKFDRDMKLDTKRPWDGTNSRPANIEPPAPEKPKPD